MVVLNNFANLIRATKLDGISQFVMAYGGLRGAIAFSLAVILEEEIFPSRRLFITTTVFVVYFTNIVLVSRYQLGEVVVRASDDSQSRDGGFNFQPAVHCHVTTPGELFTYVPFTIDQRAVAFYG